ncbi:bifunctional serine/threonine-protein kinase/ABC transporter substrate-binding protein [Streptomyces sp.]|uniref:bifunctional serine/threonine-protein kinase/ABC transporter substrate-binding protein n=1 Tax=Streptomyces sp. TaxID=1931 RepID=UPI002D77739B|nr:bifunctional serine/threonine-protein kinase/ABC transporter substrate-binding protein [Streptomyces sp.]HET6358932.1 bifunctional serine/threonine-protein kinase/ABC transporter substrate-binding protein [Streptomyces sp.]
MEPLRGADPARIAGYRMLRRLGAGGMGVVYLARSGGGSLAAVKVIRGAYAHDPGFRARFRREVETAGRVSSPWVVPLLDADPDAESPWLATAFVPGPSLAEAVEECGPLPYASVRFLGARLAEALDAVHGAGLVHRDVKPGNVLLAVDGPRMIDFGIARMPEDTALTASGMVVGSPGFLSPEQAQGRGREIGPASDVFSLGCLLAYAVTGMRPFGRGSAAEVLVRTVHDEPELDGVPAKLLPLLRGCLVKDSGSRLTVAEIRRTLDEADPHVGDGDGGGWLPESLTRLIARGSTAVLSLPAVDATEISGATTAGARPGDETVPAPEGAPKGSTRRRFLVLGSATGVLAAGGTAAWWTADRSGRAGAQGTRTRSRLPQLVVALHADLSGNHRTVGRAQENGVRLAVEHLNSRVDRGFELALQVHDDAGSTTRAERVARQLAADDRVRAVIGPTTDACAKAVLGQYQRALLPVVSVSVGLDDVSAFTYRVYAATRPTDGTLAAPLVAHLVRTARARRTALVDDTAEGDFSWEICTRVSEALRSGQHTTTRRTLAAKDDAAGDFRALAESVTDSDAVVFAGGYARAAKLARALRSTGYSGARLATQRALDPRFLTSAGDAAEGWVFSTAFLDPTRVAAAKPFVTAYRKRFNGAAPPWYSAEAYDATLFVARAMTTLGASHAERGAIVDRLRDTDYLGITKRLHYTASSTPYNVDGLYLFQASGGRFRCLGQYENATA